MPYPKEHSARITSPKRYRKRSFRSKRIAKGVRLIMGKQCASCPMETQAVRFDACEFSPSEARAWLKRHGMAPVKFEPSSGGCQE